MSKIDVFISYNSLDRRIAEGLRLVLSSAGFSCWLDSDGMAAGEKVPDAVRRAVDNCRFLCAIITPRYGKTWYTRMEAEQARGSEGMLAPVRLLPCLMEGELPAFIGERHYIDFRSNPARAQERLVADLRKHREQHESRAKWAMAFGAAATFLGSVLIASQVGSNDRRAAEADYHRSLLTMADHHLLGRVLSDRGRPVPARKDDRVSAVQEGIPMEQALDELFTSKELADMCRGLDMPVDGSKAARIRRLLLKD